MEVVFKLAAVFFNLQKARYFQSNSSKQAKAVLKCDTNRLPTAKLSDYHQYHPSE